VKAHRFCSNGYFRAWLIIAFYDSPLFSYDPE